MTTEPHMADTTLFANLFVTLAQAVSQNLSLAHLGLSNLELITVITVYTHPGIAMSALAEQMGISGPQLSRTIGQLEARDLVRRAHNPANRRVVNVMRTTAGVKLAEDHMAMVQQRLAERLAGLSAADHAALAKHLGATIDLLAKVGIVQLPPPGAQD
ncbi:MarR family winged helix-turn-helix transcriptional regulator [Lacticaseibacillus kribbianus]|uniref:MarR family winged helix-turn-helix transcriptional regulator n=1 Tax=Lacticaseibacillus kribbianus TaxID=2926292 RepID=UPI001CD3C9BB|nr:MarR family transcriptional regulator [Lacticaseibacillus kribbianus]